MQAQSDSSTHDAPSPAQLAELDQLISGFRISQAIYVVAELGIADLLASGPQGSDALARAAGADEDALYRVLRFLTGVGLFAEVAPRRFALTGLGAGLRRDVPGSIRPKAVNILDEPHWQAWGQLRHSVQTGEVGFQKAYGMELFELPPRASGARRELQPGDDEQHGTVGGCDRAGIRLLRHPPPRRRRRWSRPAAGDDPPGLPGPAGRAL